jgi:outer membrane protein assembly factor BamA
MRTLLIVLASAAFCMSATLSIAQTYHPQNIRFVGVSNDTQEELLTAYGLKPGNAVTLPEIKAHGQKLMDTGMFSALSYTFDSQNLVYHLTPASTLYPIQLTNLPLTAGKELDAKIHALVPLYHGKVPGEGGVNEQVRAALEQILAAQGLKATVQAMASVSLSNAQETAISYSIVSPDVLVGEIAPEDSSLTPEAKAILAKIAGTPYDQQGSPHTISTYLENYYHDRGYWKAAIHAAPQGAPASTAEAIHIPFVVFIKPGQLYRFAKVQLSPDLLVTQAAFDKQAALHPGDVADHEHIIENWQYIARQYHNHGYAKAEVHPQPSYDDATATVSYQVSVDPGPIYTMGKLTIENVSDDLRAAILAAWKVKPGETFNEGAILGFLATHDVNPALERVFASVRAKYTLHLNDAERTVDVALRLEKRH